MNLYNNILCLVLVLLVSSCTKESDAFKEMKKVMPECLAEECEYLLNSGDDCFQVYDAAYVMYSSDSDYVDTVQVFVLTSHSCPDYITTFYYSNCSILCNYGGFGGEGSEDYTYCGDLGFENLIEKELLFDPS